MHRFFHLLLMLLLVLRGLVGTAMAAEMVPALPAVGPAQQAQLVQQPLHLSHMSHTSHTSHTSQASVGSATVETVGVVVTAEHVMHAQNGGDESHAPCSDPSASPCDGSAHTHGLLCSACEICHSAVLLPLLLNTSPHPGAVEVRPVAMAPFASAAAARAIKPPIA